MEQQQADRTIPVEGLRVTLIPPNGRTIGGVTLKVPGEHDVALPAGNSFVVERLDQYGAVVVELA